MILIYYHVAKVLGSFTGIRIGISTVKAFSDVKHIPIIGVTSLESLAYNIKENSLIASIIDAKNDNVYFALYELKNCTYSIICEPISDNITNIIDTINYFQNKLLSKIILVGDGAVVHKDFLESKIKNSCFASSEENTQTSISVRIICI